MQYDIYVNLQIRLSLGRIEVSDPAEAAEVAGRTFAADRLVQNGISLFTGILPDGAGLELKGLTVDCEQNATTPEQDAARTPDEQQAEGRLHAALMAVRAALVMNADPTVATTPIQGCSYVAARFGANEPMLWYARVTANGALDDDEHGEGLQPCNSLEDVQDFFLCVESMDAMADALEAWVLAPAFATLSLRHVTWISVLMEASAWYYDNGRPRSGTAGYYRPYFEAEHFVAEWYYQAAIQVGARLIAKGGGNWATTPIGGNALIVAVGRSGGPELFFGTSKGRGDIDVLSLRRLHSRKEALKLGLGAATLREAATNLEAWLTNPTYQSLTDDTMTALGRELELMAMGL